MFHIIVYIGILLIRNVVFGLPHQDASSQNTLNAIQEPSKPVEHSARTLAKDCAKDAFSTTCLKIEAIAVLEKLNSKEELRLLPGISVVREPNSDNLTQVEEVAAEIARSFPGKPEERLDQYLLYRLGSYLDTHSVKLRLLEPSEDTAAAVGGARKSSGLGGGKKGGMSGLMAAAMMMKGTMMTMGMGGLAMIAGKALMTAMLSLMLSAIIGLKSLTSGGGKSTTYEIVTKPIYTHSHSHSASHAHEDAHGGGGYGGHSGYGRSYQDVKRRR